MWGNTYQITLKPIVSLQKRVIRIMTFSKPDEHSGPLFKQLEILLKAKRLGVIFIM